MAILKALVMLLGGGLAIGIAMTAYLLAVVWCVRRCGGDPHNPWVPITAVAALYALAWPWL